MKFGQSLKSNLTSEWRSQYLEYEALKSLFYRLHTNLLPQNRNNREELPSRKDSRRLSEQRISSDDAVQCYVGRVFYTAREEFAEDRAVLHGKNNFGLPKASGD